MSNPLLKWSSYRGEEYNSDTKILSIEIGGIVFETTEILGRFTWLARTKESESYAEHKQRFGVLAASTVMYWRRGNAERSMRKFINRLATK